MTPSNPLPAETWRCFTLACGSINPDKDTRCFDCEYERGHIDPAIQQLCADAIEHERLRLANNLKAWFETVKDEQPVTKEHALRIAEIATRPYDTDEISVIPDALQASQTGHGGEDAAAQTPAPLITFSDHDHVPMLHIPHPELDDKSAANGGRL